MANAPLSWTGWQEVPLICLSGKAKYFLFWGLTYCFRKSEVICPSGQFVAAEGRHARSSQHPHMASPMQARAYDPHCLLIEIAEPSGAQRKREAPRASLRSC
jgi:hypothetical protein